MRAPASSVLRPTKTSVHDHECPRFFFSLFFLRLSTQRDENKTNKIKSAKYRHPQSIMSQASSSTAIPAKGVVIGSHGRIYPVRTSAAPSAVQLQQQQQQKLSSNIGQKRYRADLGPGGFRSQSHLLVDRNQRSRENVMRAALEELLGQPFVKVRPPFLLNPATKRKLELDAFSESLRLGVEFDGEQVRRAQKKQRNGRKQKVLQLHCFVVHSPLLLLSVFSTTSFPMLVIARFKIFKSNR